MASLSCSFMVVSTAANIIRNIRKRLEESYIGSKTGQHLCHSCPGNFLDYNRMPMKLNCKEIQVYIARHHGTTEVPVKSLHIGSLFSQIQKHIGVKPIWGYQHTCQHQKDSNINVKSSVTPLSYSTQQKTLDSSQQI